MAKLENQKEASPNRRERAKIKLRGLTDVIKAHKGSFAVYIVLRTFVIIALIVSCIRGNYENAFVCVLSLILFLAPAFITANFGIEFPSTMEIIVFLFIFAAEILGEIQCYYIKFPYWDIMLHTLNGFLCAACGFGLVDILNKNPKVKFKMSPIFLAVVAFCFSMTIGVLWEFFEFGCDTLLHKDTQKDTIIHSITSVDLDPTGSNSPVTIDGITEVTVNGEKLTVDGYLDIGLIDTMQDLFVNFIGAAVFSVIGYFNVKSRSKGRFVRRFVPRLRRKQYTLDETEYSDIWGDDDFEESGGDNALEGAET